ncbi:MAG: hypothetical protein ABSB80_07225 [Methanoregula sp.]|jgi:hypothetical protein|uniref:hypothetical protein n=1 Tax=Methanoregula sp. TaxID=2052170 RepID=UPI003D0E9BAF
MSTDRSAVPYPTLVATADKLLDDCEDDVVCLSIRIGSLDADLQSELLVSDLLNAYQVFYYSFRTAPDDLLRERLELEPASALIHGLKIAEIDLLEISFFIRDNEPLITISDGEKVVAEYTGRHAYADAMKYVENPQ